MRLFYSGAANFEAPQPNVSQSLGNYISSDQVPNDRVGATLSSISRLIKQDDDKQVFLLVLKNNTGSDATGITIYYDYPTIDVEGVPTPINKYKVELAFVDPAIDSNGDPIYEKIDSSKSLPLTGTFAEYVGSGSPAAIGDLSNEQTIGIWFKATLDPTNNTPLTDQELFDNYESGNVVDQSKETISFFIEYT
tara:strand:+ start:15160 stop:15738 length:579 start_codon:yes stop_codon:yes gene_type:complete